MVNLSKKVNNETLTENLIIKWLNNQDNIKAPGDSDERWARQYPLGKRRPDFVTFYDYNGELVFLIIEAKFKDHRAGDLQVLEYIDLVKQSNKEQKVIGISASFKSDGVLKLSAFHKENNEINKLKIKNNDNLEFIVKQLFKQEEGLSRKNDKLIEWRKLLDKELKQLHNYVRSYCKAPFNEKINLLNGIFIALRSSSFIENMNKYEDYDYSKEVFAAIGSVMHSKTYDRDQRAAITTAFKFLDVDGHPASDPKAVPAEILGIPEITGYVSFCKFAANFIYNKIIVPLKKDDEFKKSAQDISSVVYNEFIRYAKGDGKDLGIVLTPEHICELMVELLDLQPTDILLDSCTGSGAFLIEGMKKKIKSSVTAEEEYLSCKNLIGVEYQPSMYSLAVANMLFNNADIGHLYLGSCFEETIIDKIKELKPNKAILNPPYAMKGEGLHEWNFVKHTLSFLPKDGKCAVIVPTSCGIQNEAINNQFKIELLEQNRLDCIIQCNDQLFYPIGVVANIYIFTAGIPHEENRGHMTFTANFKNDGFKVNRSCRIANGNFNELKKDLLDNLTNMNVSTKSNILKIKADDEWDFSMADICPELSTKDLFLAEKEFEYFNSLNYLGKNIDTSSWKKFNINDLFDVNAPKKVIGSGKFPEISGQTTNNGVKGWVDKYNMENVITISSVGAYCGTAFWHPYKIWLGSNVQAYIPKFKTSNNICLFICTILTKTLRPKYSYGKTASITRISKELIFLPHKDDIPDWEYIENFMNNLKENENS